MPVFEWTANMINLNDGKNEDLLKHRAEVLDVCITEYNEKSFVDGIREEGRKEGRKEGQNLLATVVLRLRNGETPEQILASGVDAKTIELAETIK